MTVFNITADKGLLDVLQSEVERKWLTSHVTLWLQIDVSRDGLALP